MAFGTKNQDSVCVVFDNGNGKVIAAGPAHHINVEFLHPALIRSVLIRDYGKYRVGIQRWEHNGEEFVFEKDFTSVKEYDENDYKTAAAGFAALSLELALTHPHLWH
jgi:hypothetical protein